MVNIDGNEITTPRDVLLAAASGLVPLSDVEEPVTPRDKLLYKIAEDREAIIEEQENLDGRVKDLEENPVDPETVKEAVYDYMDDHPDLTHLGFYRDSDGDLCESDE